MEHKNIAKIHHCELIEGTPIYRCRDPCLHKKQEDMYILQLLQLHPVKCQIKEKDAKLPLLLIRTDLHPGLPALNSSLPPKVRPISGRLPFKFNLPEPLRLHQALPNWTLIIKQTQQLLQGPFRPLNTRHLHLLPLATVTPQQHELRHKVRSIQIWCFCNRDADVGTRHLRQI